MRKHGVLADPRDLQAHDHVAWLGRGQEPLDRVAAAFFAAGGRRNERMLYVAQTPDVRRLSDLPGAERLAKAGTLSVLEAETLYGLDPAGWQGIFQDLLDGALNAGYRGLRVAADNTALASGGTDALARWLAWEHQADAFQEANPASGICYFDRERLGDQALADLAAVHPLRCAGFSEPPFALFADGDALRVVGTLDCWSAGQLARVLGARPPGKELVLDFAQVEFVDHHGLLALGEVARSRQPIRIRNAQPVVHKVLQILGAEVAGVSAQAGSRR